MNKAKNEESSSSVIEELFSDCCGNIQSILDNTCLDYSEKFTQNTVYKKNNETAIIDREDDELVPTLLKLFRNDLIYDLSIESLPYIHPVEETEIIDAAKIAEKKQIYYSCYLPSGIEKEKVRMFLNNMKEKKDLKVEIIGNISDRKQWVCGFVELLLEN